MKVYLCFSLLEKLLNGTKEERGLISEELIQRSKSNIRFFTSVENLTRLCMKFPESSEKINTELLNICEEVFPFSVETLSLSLSLMKDKSLSETEAFDLASGILGNCNEALGCAENLENQKLIRFIRLGFKSK